MRDRLLRLDRVATLAVQRLHAPSRDRVVKRVSFFGSQRFMIPATIAAAAALFGAGQGRLAAIFGTAVLGARALSPLLKWQFRRARPDLWPALETEKSHSFPSTHSTMGAVFFGGLGAVVFRLTPAPLWRSVALLLCAAAIAAIAFSRVYLGAHWLSDVAGGVALGLGWLALWTLVWLTAFGRAGAGSRARPDPGPAWEASCTGLAPAPRGTPDVERRAHGQATRFASRPPDARG